jgi:pyridoxine 5-phosphate synthase
MNATGLKLGVNVDHVATLRQARGTTYPSPAEAARLCEAAGAQGITAHLREDRRHIQDRDLEEIQAAVGIPLNLEMACVDSIVRVAMTLRPAEACLVPERREELTTEGGLDVAGQLAAVAPVVRQLQEAGIEVSLFIDPDRDQITAARDAGARVVELHTGSYCDAAGPRQAAELERLIAGARCAHALGLQVNAGHGIHLGNIGGIREIPHLDTLNIGHSIVARAVLVGMSEAVREMLAACRNYRGGKAVG